MPALHRYWAVAVPIYLWTLLVYLILLYNAVNLMNNNPFEYWVTHHDPGYNRYVLRIKEMCTSPLE